MMVEVKYCDQNGLSGDVKIPIDSRLQRRGRMVSVKDGDLDGLSGHVKISRSRHRQLSGSNTLSGSVG